MTSKKKIRVVIKSSVFNCDAWFTYPKGLQYSKQVFNWWKSLNPILRKGDMIIEFKHE